MKKVIIAGYYGFENVGDDVILASMIKDLKNEISDIKIVVLSNNPSATKEQYDVDCLLWRNYNCVYAEIKDCDLLIVGGGGLYNCYLDYPANRMLDIGHEYFGVFIFGLPIVAALNDVPCMIFGVGASPTRNDDALNDMGLGLSCADVITVRDEGTGNIFKMLPGCAALDIKVTADPAFRIDDNIYFNLRKYLGEDKPLIAPIIGISLRNWEFYGNEHDTVSAVAYAINQFVGEFGGTVIFLPFDNGGVVGELSTDKLIFEKVISQLNDIVKYFHITQYIDPNDASALVASCDIAVMMRLHAVILSIKNGVPHVALKYDEKVLNILKDNKLDNLCFDLQGIEGEALYKKLVSIWDDRFVLKEKLISVSKSLNEKALQNSKYAVELLLNKKNRNKFQNNERLAAFIYARQKKEFVKTVYNETFIENILNAIRKLINNGQYKEVVEKFGSDLRIMHYNPEMTYLVALAHHVAGDKQYSLECYDLALKLMYPEFWVRYNRGALYMTLMRYDEALIDLEKACVIDVENADATALLEKLKLRMN